MREEQLVGSINEAVLCVLQSIHHTRILIRTLESLIHRELLEMHLCVITKQHSALM
jgi:hypothetical protein